ncbi:Thiol-disulfide isomerase/thioredoxin-like protein [Caballeronia sordidicola]|uniref:Thiol-disulfide isomerase/thioredoxin-like protein n=1 Tax=Caballeronia sordidicola TaxID=196367 RepID=A0A158HVP5_CABSO|nr:TlpA disulfide reductase family protein [Caballeronia sordidicola]SAL48386.1 Thiol-disulfide isomerase/thioredoxin-like protein [Caballeronia sordidicola]
MNVGLFTLPIAPLVFLVSVVVALLAGWIFRKGHTDVDGAIFTSVFIALIVARLSFAWRYLPAYKDDLWKILDYRDQGFDSVPGLMAGACLVIFFAARRRAMRVPLLAAVISGSFVWGGATVAMGVVRSSGTIPVVSLLNMEGVRQPLSKGNGRPVVLNLWATWCPPCQAEMPVLEEAQRNIRGIEIVFVNQGETREVVDAYLHSRGIGIKNAFLDPQLTVAKAVAARAYPTTLFYDAQGHLLSAHLGQFSRATFMQAMEQFYPDIAASVAQ